MGGGRKKEGVCDQSPSLDDKRKEVSCISNSEDMRKKESRMEREREFETIADTLTTHKIRSPAHSQGTRLFRGRDTPLTKTTTERKPVTKRIAAEAAVVEGLPVECRPGDESMTREGNVPDSFLRLPPIP